MGTKLLCTGIVLLATASGANAETCNIQSVRAPGHWQFVKVYDLDTGKVVLQRAINGGEHHEVIVSGHRMRVDWKLAGGKDYKAGKATTCKDGHTVRI